MTNSYTLPVEGNDAFVNTDAFVATKQITSEGLSRIAPLQNYAHAYTCVGPVINQYFPDGVLYHNTSGSFRAGVLRYRVPLLSSFHYGYRVLLRYSTNAVLPSVRWKVTSQNGTVTYHTHTLSLTGGLSVIGYSSLTISQSTDSSLAYKTMELEINGTICIHSVYCDRTPLSSPLSGISSGIRGSDGTARAFIPLSDDTFGSERAVSANYLHYIADNLEALSNRPRHLFSMSGINVGYDAVTNPFSAITTRPQTNLLWRDLHNLGSVLVGMPYLLNPDRKPFKFIVHLYLQSQTTDFTLTLNGNDILISAGDSGWKTYTFNYNYNYPFVKPRETFDGITPKQNLIMTSPDLLRSNGYRCDSTPIQAISVFGV